MELENEIFILARDLIQRHPLRGFDAVHLALALSLKKAHSEEISFAAADERLLVAAGSEQLQAVNVEAGGAR